MNLVNKIVQHKTFGKGEVCELTDNIITVRFGPTVRKFIFPDAFREYLSCTEKKSMDYVDEILEKSETAIKRNRERQMRDAEKRRLLRSLPLNGNSQAAFGFSCNDKKEVMKEWTLFVGNFLSGHKRGQPRIPSKIYPNSACLLTYCENGDPEEKRYIWGVFMVEDDFIGSECVDGIIPAHEKYRIILTEEESKKMGFWKYFTQDQEKKEMKWGTIEFKYLSNIALAQILQDIYMIKQNPGQRQLCEEFIDYFCNLNKIDKKHVIDDIAEIS